MITMPMPRLALTLMLVVAAHGCGDPQTPPTPRGQGEPATTTEPASPMREAPAQAATTPTTERAAAPAPEPTPELALPLHGVATHLITRVLASPDPRGKILGYMRRGTTFRASERVPGVGCERGFHRVVGGGFVCRGDGVAIGASPQTFTPAPQPARIGEPMPYVYAFTGRKSAPQFFRIPTVEEETTIMALFARLDAEDAARADAGVPTSAPRGDASVPAGDASVPIDASAVLLEGEPPSDDASVTNVVADGGVPATPGDGLPDYVRMRMLRGFYTSVDGTEVADERTFVRTVRGAYVREELLIRNEPPTRRGVELAGAVTLPVAFVYRPDQRRLLRDAAGALREGPALPQHTAFPVVETTGQGASRVHTSPEGWLVRDGAVRIARLRARPSRIPEGAKWIHVDLSDQVLVAYEGDRPVFTTTVSSGRSGFATPTGTWRIQSKHVTTTMDDLAAGDEAYSIEDVPWTMFYQGGYALHTAFWHNQFGRVRSHGCTNLAPADARYLFNWSDPVVPEGWHGAFATRDEGTFVVVER